MSVRSSSSTTVRVATLILVLSLGASVWTARRLDALRPQSTLRQVMYIRSPRLVKMLSLGFTGLAADIYWTRAVQYFGSQHHDRSTDYQLLYPLLNLTAELDPHLLVAYEFGSFFLAQKPPEGAGDPDQAAAFVERGIKANPGSWRLYYHLGFIQAIERKDYAAAAEAFRRGSEVPGALPWMKVMAAAMSQRGGDAQTSRYLWSRIYESSEDKTVKSNAATHLIAFQVDDEVTFLQEQVQRYLAHNGMQPQSWAEVIQAGLIQRVPVDPSGLPYRLRAGRVELAEPQLFPFVTKGLPPGQQPEQTLPNDFDKR